METYSWLDFITLIETKSKGWGSALQVDPIGIPGKVRNVGLEPVPLLKVDSLLLLKLDRCGGLKRDDFVTKSVVSITSLPSRLLIYEAKLCFCLCISLCRSSGTVNALSAFLSPRCCCRFLWSWERFNKSRVLMFSFWMNLSYILLNEILPWLKLSPVCSPISVATDDSALDYCCNCSICDLESSGLWWVAGFLFISESTLELINPPALSMACSFCLCCARVPPAYLFRALLQTERGCRFCWLFYHAYSLFYLSIRWRLRS